MTESNTSLLGFTYQGTIDLPTPDGIGASKDVQFTTTISKDCSQADIDSLLDKCRCAITRQRVFAQIERKSIDLRNFEELLEKGSRGLAATDAKNAKRAEDHEGRAGRGLSTSELKTRDETVRALENAAGAAKDLKEKIRSLRAMVGQDLAGCPTPEAQGLVSVNVNDEQARWADNGGAAPS